MGSKRVIKVILVISLLLNVIVFTAVKKNHDKQLEKAWGLLSQGAYYANNIAFDNLDKDAYRCRYNKMLMNLHAASAIFEDSNKQLHQDIASAIHKLVIMMEYPNREKAVIRYSRVVLGQEKGQLKSEKILNIR
ncbi:hypothetical protein IMX26_17340 [Clostridium sp. 'deep sea']|uniref:hypothetical protein n=1 Tax=Clostridium sp. 'deep sea' TaxID=2779445 RepID=UPI00189675BC|nr:hypothetical protein [Clostridium sp. 'deep sea']QOR35196.1 hypothetical protein IMX26_17340 [Clostridium sp. 'deep sea']